MNQPTFVRAGVGKKLWVVGDVFTYMVTGEESGGSYFTLEVLVNPGGGSAIHIHYNEDEQFYVLEGNVTFRVGDQTHQASKGDFVHIPKGTIHEVRNNGTTSARLLATFAPAGIENFFQDVFPELRDDVPFEPLPIEEIIRRDQAYSPKYGQETLLPGDPRVSWTS